jgi:hypothetical protein
VALNREQALRLAHALRGLRESTWPEHVLTQVQLAEVFSSEGKKVAPATLSSWESTTNPKMPSAARISAYARFFCTERSVEAPIPKLISKDQLTVDELDKFSRLESRLLDLYHAKVRKAQRIFQFDAGPVIVICPEAPLEEQGPLASVENLNFTKMQRYSDLDALMELYGHLRAENPALDVFHGLATEVARDDLLRHVILLGGIGWNEITRRFQSAIRQVPIKQVADPDFEGGDIFVVETSEGKQSFYPKYEDFGDGEELVADVGYIARLRNPFKVSRTLTICNGIFSRGVFGAVRCLTDVSVRDENEKYLTDRFPSDEFAILLQVPVAANETLSPDLQNPEARLYEWAPNEDFRPSSARPSQDPTDR